VARSVSPDPQPQLRYLPPILADIVAQFLVSITNIQYSLFKSNVIRTVII
jgi:hypothetical protein